METISKLFLKPIIVSRINRLNKEFFKSNRQIERICITSARKVNSNSTIDGM